MEHVVTFMMGSAVRTILIPAFAYFAIVFAVGFVLGVVRMSFVAPYLGDVGATLVELPLMLWISWCVCAFVMRWFAVPPARIQRLFLGCLAFLLLIGAEIVLGMFGLNRTLGELLASYLAWGSALGLVAQMGFALFPVIQRDRT